MSILSSTLTYSNVGTVLASGVVITDTLPLSLTNVISLSSGAGLSLISGTVYLPLVIKGQ